MTAGGFRSITGHKDIIRHFQAAIAGGRVNHAYLIAGDAGSGKRMMADAFAETLLCAHPLEEGGGPDACLQCSSCLRAMSRSHPDILHVTHEKAGVISVGDIRSQVVNTIDILPYESRYKVYIIPEAEKMNQQAQNALLLSMEEPPEYVVILLLTSSPESLLPTIHSRCVRLTLTPLRDREVQDYLTEEMHLPDYEVSVLTAYAQGNIGRAVSAAEDGIFIRRRDETIALIKGLHHMDNAAMAEYVKGLKEERDGVEDVLDLLLMWFRDVLLFKATAEIDHLVFAREISAIRAEAAASSYEGLQEILSGVDRCRVRLKANVNFELAVMLLLETIKENCHA